MSERLYENGREPVTEYYEYDYNSKLIDPEGFNFPPPLPTHTLAPSARVLR